MDEDLQPAFTDDYDQEDEEEEEEKVEDTPKVIAGDRKLGMAEVKVGHWKYKSKEQDSYFQK